VNIEHVDQRLVDEPPFGPKSSSFITSSSEINSLMFTAQSYGNSSFAGSKFTMATGLNQNTEISRMITGENRGKSTRNEPSDSSKILLHSMTIRGLS
jgi:hypothetical protein